MHALLLLAVIGCGNTSTEPAAPPDIAATEARIAAELLLLNWGDLNYVGEATKPERSKEEALSLAADLSSQARAAPETWPDLLRQHSDSPIITTGGRIESWPRSKVPRDFSAILSVEVGGFTEPLDTHLGVAVLHRVEPFGASVLAGRRLVVAYAGANRAPGEVTRTWAEAKVHADYLAKQAQADPSGFESLVTTESDGWDAPRGGFMGTWTVETSRWPLITEAALSSVAIGGITRPVRTPFGYEVYARLEPDPAEVQLAGSHILISHAAAKSSRDGRSRAEALELAQQIARKSEADPTAFGVLAREESDDGSAERGGDLGAWTLGKLPEELEKTFLTMHFGEVSGPVESPYGFHVLHRRKSPADMAIFYRVPGGDPSEGPDEVPEGAEYGVPGLDHPPHAEAHGADDGHGH